MIKNENMNRICQQMYAFQFENGEGKVEGGSEMGN